MLRIGYQFDGENLNEDLEELIQNEVEEHGFALCGDDQDLLNDQNIRWLEFESDKDSAADMNKHEKSFIGSEDAQTLEEIVGVSIPLSFEHSPWDDDDEEPEEIEPEAPRSSQASSDKKIYFFGHCTKGTSDKIWGAVKAQGEWFTFWGARTKKLTFKRSDEYSNHASLDTLVRSKRGKGYVDVTMEDMNRLDPEFETRFEEELVLCLMANKFHHA